MASLILFTEPRAQEILYESAYFGNNSFEKAPEQTRFDCIEAGAKAGHPAAQYYFRECAKYGLFRFGVLDVCQYYLQLTDTKEIARWRKVFVKINKRVNFLPAPIKDGLLKQLFLDAPNDPAAVRWLESVDDPPMSAYQSWIGPVVKNIGRFPWFKFSDASRQRQQEQAYVLWLCAQCQ